MLWLPVDWQPVLCLLPCEGCARQDADRRAGSRIRGIRRLYDEHPRASLLAVGHADTAGEAAYNAALSLVRADAVAAFLTDDVAGWEAAL